MSWTNGEVRTGDFGHREWQFRELLAASCPDTPIPGGGACSPHTVTLTYSYGKQGWGLAPWHMFGPRVSDTDEILDEQARLEGDAELYYSEGGEPGNRPTLPTPDWLKRFATARMKMLPTPPSIPPEVIDFGGRGQS